MNKRLFSALAASLVTGLLVAPTTAWAHVKWFVETDTPTADPYSISEPAVMIWTAAFILTLIVAWIIRGKLKVPQWLTQFGKKQKEGILWVVHFLIALWLVINSFSGTLFIPTLEINQGLEPLLWLQGITGVLIAARRYGRLSALLLTVLYITAASMVGALNMMEHFFILGIALWLVISDEKHPNNEWSTPVLRITAGISLIMLGFQEKLLDPTLGMVFLESHNWNFMAALGMDWFTNRIFILSAGMTEVLFGVLYLSGLLTRITTIAFGVVLVATAVMLGIGELIGHLPIFALAIIFLVYGGGKRGAVSA